MNKITLSEQIRKLRISKKYTLAIMAERLGVTTSSIAAYENGSRNPSFDILIKIARMFNVTIDNLLGYSDKDLIDISDLTPDQRNNVEKIILTYKKFNSLIVEMFEADIKNNHRDFNDYFADSFDDFIKKLEEKKREKRRFELTNEKIPDKIEDKNETKNSTTEDLEKRIKALEEMFNK